MGQGQGRIRPAPPQTITTTVKRPATDEERVDALLELVEDYLRYEIDCFSMRLRPAS